MKRCRRTVARGAVCVTLAWVTVAWVILTWTTGCSRQLTVPGSNRTADSPQLPFERVSDSGGISPTAGFTSDGIPVGTEVAIRLQMMLSSADSRAGDSFQAVLDEPLMVAGKTIAPRGTPVTGSVVAAKASGGRTDPGYLRLTLASMVMNGKSLPLQTSSIFAKGGGPNQKLKATTIESSAITGKGSGAEAAVNSSHGTGISINPAPGDVRFSTGHRLSFRLAQALHLSG